MNWERWAARVARNVERRIDEARTSLRGPRVPRFVALYRGFGNPREVHVAGRVLASTPPAAAQDAAAWWRNLAAAFRHLESDEVPGVRIRVRFGDSVREAVTDDEGFFRAWLTPAAAPDPARLWHDVHAEVVGADGVEATGSALLPRPAAAFGVISDIDDTVIRTDATRLLPMLRRTLLENARMRLPFPGVAEFYQALHHGAGDAGNPIFYVSSSPWNLFPVLEDFLDHQRIPAGPLMLRDWGLSDRGFLPRGHGEHKLGAIRQILECYPHLPFVLIGDSGQEDPEIYRDVVHAYGHRITAVYIRDVTPGPGRADAVRRLGEEIAAAGSVLLLSDDTAACARHAADRGLITREAAEEVVRAVSSSAARPD